MSVGQAVSLLINVAKETQLIATETDSPTCITAT